MKRESITDKKWYGRRLFLFGLTNVVASIIFFLPDLLTNKNSLLQISGKVIYSDLVIDDVSNRGKTGIESNSRRATLVFVLDGQNRLFKLVENIWEDYDHIEYKKLLEQLRVAKNVLVWIKSSDEQIHDPKIFQIDIDNKTVIDFVTVKYKDIWIFALLMFIGLTSMAVVLYKEYSKGFKIFES